MPIEYNLTVIGPRGSGKTLFLTAIYYQFRGSFYQHFEADFGPENLRREVHKNLQRIQGGAGEFPSGTMDLKKYRVDFYHRPQNNEKNILFTVHLMDYPGGYLDRPADDVNAEFIDFLKNSQSIIILVDGEKIIRLVDQENEENRNDLYNDLNKIVDWLQFAHNQCPTHVLITKSDIFDRNNSNHKLDNIRSTLRQHGNFRNFLDNHHKPIHFIGITSLGNDIISRDSDGRMRRVPAPGNINPRNIDYSVLLVLIDHIRMLYNVTNTNNQAAFFDYVRQVDWLLKAIQRAAGVCGYTLPTEFAQLNHLIDLIFHFKDKLSPFDMSIDNHKKTLENNIARLTREESLDYLVHRVMSVHKDYIHTEFKNDFIANPNRYS